MTLYRSSVTFFIQTILILAGLGLTGCGKVFENAEDRTDVELGQENRPENAGIPAVISVTVVPTGKSLTVLALSSIEKPVISRSRTDSNEIAIHVALRSEKEEYSAVHLHELEKRSAENGVYSLDSSLGCRYTIGNREKPNAYIAAVGGSCVNTVAVELPDHELPRSFLGASPLFSGRIELADLKTVMSLASDPSSLARLLKTYAGRLSAAEKPLTIADLASFLPRLGDDSKRIDAVAVLAPRVMDAANAGDLPRDSFANVANRTRAVKILLSYR